ncbi:MAG TPA: SDR family oxidoreductase [Micromonosporaceae bacterium]|nr:SDR family oxidoreductase [Micromonosporaceae bacterium]
MPTSPQPGSWPRSVLVTGANRGLGLSLVEIVLATTGADVVACVRTAAAATALHPVLARHPGRILVAELDYRDPHSIHQAAQQCLARLDRLDLLVNNGAVNRVPDLPAAQSKGPLEELSPDALRAMFDTNVVGPVLTCQAFLPLLSRSSRPCVVNVSTSRASLSAVDGPGSFGYSVTKAALNMATRKLARQMDEHNGCAVAVDPGWLRTGMGGPDAPTDPADCASRLLRTVCDEGTKLNGRFVTADGADLPW